jgi:hypothetical protein
MTGRKLETQIKNKHFLERRVLTPLSMPATLTCMAAFYGQRQCDQGPML